MDVKMAAEPGAVLDDIGVGVLEREVVDAGGAAADDQDARRGAGDEQMQSNSWGRAHEISSAARTWASASSA
jgi:hypothetical protein